MEIISGPVTIGGKLYVGLAAAVQHKEKTILIVGNTVEDVRNIWEDTLHFPILDKTLLQQVVIGTRNNIQG